MEESVASEDGEKAQREKISPKITRPKLPKFGSHTLGHVRHKTDPGKAVEIKNLMEEIKKWKDGSVFDQSIRPKIIKPQTIPKAHSTQTSPRASPPPGSPNFGNRGSSLNRNRSRSLKLLTDKLKSPRGGSKDTSLSPNSKIPKMKDENMRSKSADASVNNAPLFPENCQPPAEENSMSRDIMTSSVESDKDKTGTVEPIPEKDEKDDEDEKCDKGSNSSCDTVGTPEKVGQKIDSKPARDSPKLGEEEGAIMSDSDSPTTHISTYTLHPIDRNSEFLRLRQTAPPKRRPAYAGLTLPKTKIPPLLKFQTDDTKENADEHTLKRVASAYDENSIKKPNKLDLLSLGGSTRKLSTPIFPSKRDECRLDLAGYNIFRSPSKESPPSLPGDESRLPGADTVSPETAKDVEEGENIEEQGAACMAVEQVVIKPTETESEKLEKRNGRSPKQKSKSDPSGNKSFDFDVSGVINSSQSQSFPLLQKDRMTDSVTEETEDQNVMEENANVIVVDKEPSDLDVINNNHENEEPEQQGSVSFSEPLTSCSGTERSGSVTDDIIFSPQSDLSEPFDEPGYQSAEETLPQSVGYEGLQRLESGGMSPVQEHEGDDDHEGFVLASSVCSGGSESSTSTPISYSPTGTLEKQNNLLSVPSPKRPIARSVSSASVLQRERKYSSSKDKDMGRKHSLTTVEDGAQSDAKTMDFLPIGDSGNIMASSMPSVWNTDRHPSVSPERDSEYVKDKRYHIVEEIYRNEKEYVDALKMLKERYMDPLKTVSGIDERVVDNIFYMIPEILTHHQIYLEFLNQVWTRWNTDTSTVGDIILKTFSGQTVQDSYLSFVENYKTSGKVIENALQTKSSVQKFVEQCQKESGSKLSLKDLIVRPIQRIPRYELLIQRLLVNTPGDHPDYALLKEAEKAMHEFALKIGSLNETQTEDGQQETLKKLELLLMTDLAVPDRSYLRHDMVNIMNKKDQCCIWMFSDLIIISSVKRKSGPVTRKVSIILKSPTGQDFAENVKHKVWLKVGLDDIEIVKSPESLKKTTTLDKEQVEEDLDILEMIQDLTNKLNCNHASMNDVVKEMTQSMRKQLVEHNLRESLQDTTKMELIVTTQEGVLNLEVNFTSGEKRASWETTFLDAKQKLSLLSDKRAAEFLQPLQITKTRAGMQFSCAAPIDGVNSSGYRDVWVCNSDGYVGHMCLLSLQPEPIVTLNTPVPGCNARILCIAAVPAHAMLRRKSSAKQRYIHNPPSPTSEGPRISIEEVDVTDEDGNQGDMSESGDVASEDGYQSDSSSSEETDDEFISTRKLFVEEEEPKRSPPTKLSTGNPESFTTSGSWTQNPAKSTMWLGTEDGCIHIFQCTDNIKTTKNKLKIQLGYPVYCILYLDNKVFVSLSNGDLMVYRRDSEGTWDSENPYTRAIGSVTAPIVKMLAVAGKLWCGRQNNICVINPLTLSVEKTFHVHQDSNRCVQCIVNSGQGVWIASQQSAKVILYHATTFEFLLEVSIAQAVNQKLQAADDIIRQHKAACLRITALLVCKDLLWIGTSAGVILTIPIPKITSTTTRGSLTVPNVTGLVYGHTGHVRFLTCVEMANTNVPPLLVGSHSRSDSANNNTRDPDVPSQQDLNKRRSSVATMTAALATRMLVISGGDGYEDFRTNVVNEAAGKDDSTNHLLLWQV